MSHLSMFSVQVPQVAYESTLVRHGAFSEWCEDADDSEIQHQYEELCASIAAHDAKGVRSHIYDLMVQRRDLLASMLGLR